MIIQSALTLASRSGQNAKLSILIFHRVLREPDPLLPNEPCAVQFDALLDHITSRFVVFPLADAVTRLIEGSLPPRALAITFDDGYADNLDVAGPILQRRDVPATLFVATGYLDGVCMWNDEVIESVRHAPREGLDLGALKLGKHAFNSTADRRSAIERVITAIKYLPPHERRLMARRILEIARAETPGNLMLTRAKLPLLAPMGIQLGAHTVSHPILAQISPDEAWREICQSKRDLEDITRAPVELFAYPNGAPERDYSSEHVRMVRDAGFLAAVSTAWGAANRTSDVLQLPRFTPWSFNPIKFDLLMLRNLRHGPEQRAA